MSTNEQMRVNKTIQGALSKKAVTQKQRDRVVNHRKRYDLSAVNRFKRYYEMGCSICGESRVVEIAHIIPTSKGGSNEPSNLIILCPTHHTLFDRDKLNEEEMEKIYDKLALAYGYKTVEQIKQESIQNT